MIRLPEKDDRQGQKNVNGDKIAVSSSLAFAQTWSENSGLCYSLSVYISLSPFTGLQDHRSLSRGVCATCEHTVLIFNEVTAQDNVLPTAGILTADPTEKNTSE